jgi:hypothetical protein
MAEQTDVPAVEGAIEVVGWFGLWPSFHDCEVIGVDLRRHDVSRLQIHAFMSLPTQTNPPYFDRGKDALVTFSFVDIVFLELAGEELSSSKRDPEAHSTLVVESEFVTLVGGIPDAK